MKQIAENVDAWQRRALLGLDILRQHELVSAEQLAAVGYCFGGSTVMQMAYAGAELDGVVSFHGSLPPVSPEQQKRITAKILIAHGEADSFVPAERVAAFKRGLDQAGADWQMVIYGGARHGFTNPDADRYGIGGMAYDPRADARSWTLMQSFLQEIFSE